MLAFDRRAAAITWTACLVVGALWLVYAVRTAIFVFVLAVFLAYMINPIVRRLLRAFPRRLSRTFATIIVFVGLVLLLAGLLAVVGPPVSDQASGLADQLPSLLRGGNVVDRIPLPGWLVPYRAKVAGFVGSYAGDLNELGAAVMKGTGRLLVTTGTGATFMVLLPILAFIMIVNGPGFRMRFMAGIKPYAHSTMWRHIVGDLDTLLGGYIRALLILAFATIVSYSVAFSIAGVPYGLLLALIAGALEFIPVLGPLVAAVLCVLVAGISGYDHLLWIAGFIALYRIFQDYVLNPYLMSNGVAVPALLVLFGLLAGEELAGVAGVFLSTPVLAAMQIFARRIVEESRSKRVPGDAA